MSYTELQVTSNFSFLRGASHPEELVEQALLYGYSKIAITDRNTLAGIVRAMLLLKERISTLFLPAGSTCLTVPACLPILLIKLLTAIFLLCCPEVI